MVKIMKKLSAKIRKIRMMRWSKLTRGEKVAKVIMTLVKWAAIAAVAVVVVGGIIAAAAGVFIAFAIAGAITGGFENASHAYRPGDYYVHIIK